MGTNQDLLSPGSEAENGEVFEDELPTSLVLNPVNTPKVKDCKNYFSSNFKNANLRWP